MLPVLCKARPYRELMGPDQPLEKRVTNLVNKMLLAEDCCGAFPQIDYFNILMTSQTITREGKWLALSHFSARSYRLNEHEKNYSLSICSYFVDRL